MPRLPARAANWAAWALLAGHAVLAWACRAPGARTSGDDAVYVLLARSLREGSYRDTWLVGAPWHHLYPPGYPAALAIWGLPFADRFDAFIIFNIAASVAMLGLIYVTVRRIGFPHVALLSLAALAVNTGMMSRVTQVASEPLATLWGVLALALLATDRPSSRALWLAGGAGILAALTRTASMAVLGAVLLELLLARRWRPALLLALAASLTIGLWLVWTAVAPHQRVGDSYVADLVRSGRGNATLIGMAARRASGAINAYLGDGLASALSVPGVRGTIVDNVIAAVVLGSGILTGLVVFWRRWRAAALGLVVTSVMLLAWPWKDPRFLTGLVPLLVPITLVGVWTLAARLRPAASLPAAAAVALVLVWGGGTQTVRRGVSAQRDCPRGRNVPAATCFTPDLASYIAALSDIRARAPGTAVVLNAKSATVFYYTGRRGVSYSAATQEDAAHFLPRLRAGPARYVLLGSIVATEVHALAPRLAAACRAFAVVGRYPPRTYLLRLRSPDEAEDDETCRAVEAYRRSSFMYRNFNADWPFL